MRRNLALITAMCLLFTCLLGFGNLDDPLTLLVSNNLVVILAKVAAAGLILWTATRLGAGSVLAGLAIGGVGIVCLAFGLVALISTPIMGAFYNYFRILDLLLLMELGTVLGLIALEMKTEPSSALVGLRLRAASWLQAKLVRPRAYLAAKFVSYFTYSKSP